MKRKGIALTDVIVSVTIITIIGIFIGEYVMGIIKINRQIDLNEKFNEISTYIENAIQQQKNIEAYTLTPRGVLSPSPSTLSLEGDTLDNFYTNNTQDVLYPNYEKSLYGCYSVDECANVDKEKPYGQGITTNNSNLFNNIYHFTLYDFDPDDADRFKQQKLFKI